MARSRSRGSRSVTSRSPIVIVPPEIVSRPASIRRSVVLPQPDGPTRTMNSPLSIVRLTSSTAVTPPENTLLTPSKTILLTVRQDNASMTTITAVEALDIRFPTSHSLDGSDAMNPDPDYSAAYVILRTDSPQGLEGHGLTFTIGRGNEVCVAAIEALRPLVLGKTLESFTADLGAFWRMITGDSQLRWIGPEKGAIHLATAAIVNAVWDLYAKVAAKPLWKLLADMSPEQLVTCVDLRYLTDAIRPDEAVEML